MTETQAPGDAQTARAAFVRAVLSTCGVAYLLQLAVLAPGDVEALFGFSADDLGTRWWTVATFSLAHGSLSPLLANAAVIGLLGSLLERHWGSSEFARYYIVCAMGAWIAHLVFVAPEVPLSGAAGPALGILLAFAATNGTVRYLRVGAVSFSAAAIAIGGGAVVLGTGMLMAPAAPVAHLAHIGSAVAGWAYLRMAASVSLGRLREGVSPLPDEPDDEPPRAVPRSRARAPRGDDDIVARSNAAVAQEAAARQAAGPEVLDPAQINRVLDKISAQGLSSLTPEERKLLNEVSRRLRDG